MRNFSPLAFFLFFAAHVLAAPTEFVEHNFSIEMPQGWSAINPLPPQALLAAQSPSKRQVFVVFASNFRGSSDPNAARELQAGAKDTLIKGGCKIDPDQDTTFGGVPFVSFAAHPPTGGTLTSYIALAGNEGYLLQEISKQPDAEADAQVQSALQTFKLLAPILAPDTSSAAYQFGFNIARIAIVLAGLVVVVGVFAIIGWTLLRRK